MVDLDRLKIQEKAHGRRGSLWVVVVLCLLCLALGFGASHYYERWHISGSVKVTTVVVRSHNAEGSRQFTAGGWIEAHTPAYPLVVSARVSETIEQLRVREGQIVHPGQELVRLYDGDIRGRLDVATAEQAAADATVVKLKAGFRTEDIDAASSAAAMAAEKLRIAKATYERSKSLTDGAISRETLDTELSAYRQAEQDSAKARAALAKMQAGSRIEDIAAAEADARQAAARVALARLELSYCTISTPGLGRPLRVLKVLQHVGQKVNASQRSALLWLYDPKDMQARVDVTQSNIRSVRVGAKAIVTTEADPNKKYKGTVRRIEPLAELAKNTVTVRVAVDDPDEMLFPDMVAQISFLSADEKADEPKAPRLPVGAVLSDGRQRYVYVVEGNVARRHNVTVGPKAGGKIEIRSGLQSGQRVIVGGAEKVADGLEIEEQ